jgi:hypothetical protein
MGNMEPPDFIYDYAVVEYGYFADPILPKGYMPPPDGSSPLLPVQNLAICTKDGIDGYYLMFCSPTWEYVTFCFNETLEYSKRCPMIEFGQDVAEWQKMQKE